MSASHKSGQQRKRAASRVSSVKAGQHPGDFSPHDRSFARPVSDLMAKVLDPVMERRAGMRMDLIAAWEDMVGANYATTTRPLKLQWPRQRDEGDPFEPATLVIACEPSIALFLQHETGPIIARVNAYFGFAAVGRVQLKQQQVL